jgi:hypothetical protein
VFDTVHTVLPYFRGWATVDLRFALNLGGHGLVSARLTFRPSRPLFIEVLQEPTWKESALIFVLPLARILFVFRKSDDVLRAPFPGTGTMVSSICYKVPGAPRV